MARKVSNWFYRISTGWVTLTTLVGFLLFMVLILPSQAAQAEEDMGSSSSPDTSFFYTPEELYQMAETYGSEGRQAYIRARFTFDLVFPVVYLAFLVTAISWVYDKAFAPGSLGRFANLLPALGALFDYLENVSTSLVMARYPNPTPAIAALAPLFTLTKWIFVGGSFVVLAAELIAWGVKAVKTYYATS